MNHGNLKLLGALLGVVFSQINITNDIANHVIQRGINKSAVFFEDEDYQHYKHILYEAANSKIKGSVPNGTYLSPKALNYIN